MALPDGSQLRSDIAGTLFLADPASYDGGELIVSDTYGEHEVKLPEENFTIRYQTEIPRQVGLAGSSAIITATFRALMQFYGVEIPRHILPNWVLATEVEELKIAAGLQRGRGRQRLPGRAHSWSLVRSAPERHPD